MISKNTVKFIRSLSLKKFRSEHQAFVAEGPKVVEELIQEKLNVLEIFASPDWIQQNTELCKNIKVTEAGQPELEKISNLKTPNKVVALAKIPDYLLDDKIFSHRMVLALDNIRDPGNMGTLFRIADWFGIEHLLCSETCVDAYNPKTIQAAMGSVFRIKHYYVDLLQVFNRISGKVTIYGAFMNGNPITCEVFNKNGILLIGNEARGISEILEPLVQRKISIPLGNSSLSHAESLNASVAAAVICYEYNRQHNF